MEKDKYLIHPLKKYLNRHFVEFHYYISYTLASACRNKILFAIYACKGKSLCFKIQLKMNINKYTEKIN